MDFIPEHLLVWVYEAPSSDSLQKFSIEPDIAKWMAWNTSEIKLAMSLEESNWTIKMSDVCVVSLVGDDDGLIISFFGGCIGAPQLSEG